MMPSYETLMLYLQVLKVAVIVISALAVALWIVTKDCTCPKCAHHQNERNKKPADQAVLRHDYEHKGGGFREGDPDRFNCSDNACSRNPRRVE